MNLTYRNMHFDRRDKERRFHFPINKSQISQKYISDLKSKFLPSKTQICVVQLNIIFIYFTI